MPPCEVEMLAVGSCEYINASSESPRKKRPAASISGCSAGPVGGLIKSKFGTAHAVPYKKRKLKKSVKFSPASHFRVVECVLGPKSEDSDDEFTAHGCSTELSPAGSTATNPHSPDGMRAGDAGDAEDAGDAGDADDVQAAYIASSHKSMAAGTPGPARTSPASLDVLHEQDIATKGGDGPSTVGLICNALIMGLVDRSINNAATVLKAMRDVTKAARVHDDTTLQQKLSTGTSRSPDGFVSTTGGSNTISEEVFDAVVDRLQQLVEHLDKHQRVGLLPSTARLGKPFIPALKCLQGTLRIAFKEQHTLNAEGQEDQEECQDSEEEVLTPKTPDGIGHF